MNELTYIYYYIQSSISFVDIMIVVNLVSHLLTLR